MCIPICRDAPRVIRANGVVSSRRDCGTMIQLFIKMHKYFLFTTYN